MTAALASGPAGVFLALVVALFAAAAGFDRDRSFWPVLLVVVASYYELFAVQGGSAVEMVLEAWLLCGFASLAVAGFRWNRGFVVAGLVGHGLLDLIHGRFLPSPATPTWWPTFCLAFDVTAGGLLLLRGYAAPNSRIGIAPDPPSQAPTGMQATQLENQP